MKSQLPVNMITRLVPCAYKDHSTLYQDCALTSEVPKRFKGPTKAYPRHERLNEYGKSDLKISLFGLSLIRGARQTEEGEGAKTSRNEFNKIWIKHRTHTSRNELNTIYVIHELMHAPLRAHPDAHIPHTCTLSLAQYVTPSLSTVFPLFLSLMYNVSVCIYIHTHTCILFTDCDHPSSWPHRRERRATHERRARLAMHARVWCGPKGRTPRAEWRRAQRGAHRERGPHVHVFFTLPTGSSQIFD